MPEIQPNRRLKTLLWILLLWSLLIVQRLYSWQVKHHDEIAAMAVQQQQRNVELLAVRGTIFDRNGQPLAKTLIEKSLYINPKKVVDPFVHAAVLAPILGLDSTRLRRDITVAKANGRKILLVKRNVTLAEEAAVKETRLEFLDVLEEAHRYYPQGQLASHVVGTFGMVTKNDGAMRGNSGIELSLDDELAGQTGRARVYNDVKGNPYRTEVLTEPQPGTAVTLTLDPTLQYDAEKALEEAARASNSTLGSLVALNPYTGEILAMASYPAFDPNKPLRPGEAMAARNNVAVTTPFEPGSVFKVITLASALETTNLTPDTIINCGNGSLIYKGRKFNDHSRYSSLSMADVLAKSSNIGAINIALRVGGPNFYEYIRRFGFGRKTGVELPGESTGMLRPYKQWQPASIGSIAMGHEIGATSLQLALAGAVVANGGMLVKPRLIISRQTPGHDVVRYPQEAAERVIKPETAILMRKMMEGVVLHGTGRQAILKGYTSGGKTGSAMIFDTKSKTYVRHYNASFVGFAPVANPQIVIAVTLINTPTGEAGFGGAVAAPVFRDVASSALRMLDVPKEFTDAQVAAAKSKADLDDSTSVETASVIKDAKTSADDSVPDLPARPAVQGPVAPDLRGKTLRAVLEEAASAGWLVDVAGEGVARQQNPAPGSPLAPGTRIKVAFSR